jgi:hypothetical protein
MTQTARPQTPWLVPPGDMTSFGRSSFTLACRGHEKMGEVLSYFVYEASWQAKNEGIDSQSEDCTFITIEREQKHMLGRIKTCQKSLIAYINQLEAWGFLVADGYRHTYQVHFRKITEAIHNPPETMKKKPRGKYAPAPSPEIQSETRLSQLQSQRAKLQSRLVKLQSEMVKIQSRMVNLQNQMVKIQSSQNAESTPEQDLEGEIELSRILRSTMNLLEDSLVASASAESDGGVSFLSQLRSFEDTLKEVQNGQTPLDVSCSPEGYSQEEPVKEADTVPTPAVTSAVHDTTPETLQEIPTPEQPIKTLFPAAQPPHNSKTHKKDNRKISVLSVPKVPPRVIREAIDAIRGYALDQEGPIKHQGVILKEWCQKHTLEDFQHVIEHLTKGRCSNEKHQWWREKNHMKTFFNAAKLAELTPDILSELGHIPKPEAPPEVAPSVEEPKIVGWTPVRQIYPPKGVTVTYG